MNVDNSTFICAGSVIYLLLGVTYLSKLFIQANIMIILYIQTQILWQ